MSQSCSWWTLTIAFSLKDQGPQSLHDIVAFLIVDALWRLAHKQRRGIQHFLEIRHCDFFMLFRWPSIALGRVRVGNLLEWVGHGGG
jgi:hypothetical protein